MTIRDKLALVFLLIGAAIQAGRAERMLRANEQVAASVAYLTVVILVIGMVLVWKL